MSGQSRHSREDLRSLSDEEAEIPETEADREARFYSTRDSLRHALRFNLQSLDTRAQIESIALRGFAEGAEREYAREVWDFLLQRRGAGSWSEFALWRDRRQYEIAKANYGAILEIIAPELATCRVQAMDPHNRNALTLDRAIAHFREQAIQRCVQGGHDGRFAAAIWDFTFPLGPGQSYNSFLASMVDRRLRRRG